MLGPWKSFQRQEVECGGAEGQLVLMGMACLGLGGGSRVGVVKATGHRCADAAELWCDCGLTSR